MGRRTQRCEPFENAISAQVDREDPGVEPDVLAAHLSQCRSCRDYARVAEGLDRRFRVRVAEAVPDLAGPILAAVSAVTPEGHRQRGRRLVLTGRTRVGLAVASAVALIVGGLLLGGHLATITRSASPRVASAYPGAALLSMTQQVGKPTVVLTGTDGRPYDPATETVGRVTLLYFGYTRCPNVCPINMALTAAAISRLPAAERRDITVLFVTTDPSRDTAPAIRSWLDHFTDAYRGDPPFIGLRGSPASTHQAEEQVGMPLSYVQAADDNPDGGYQVVHAGYTLLYSEDGYAHLTVDDTETIPQYVATLHRLVTKGFGGP